MYLLRKKCLSYVVFPALCCSSTLSDALEFQPGVGVGVNYTDNANLEPDNKVSDTVLLGAVSASLDEKEGPLLYNASASLRKETYINDTFDDKRYLNLGARADWEMIRDRLYWYVEDRFFQSPKRSIDANTPANRQDTNEFIFGADIKFPVSGRQSFRLIPEFNQYYYEILETDNKQYSLAGKWSYQMFRLMNVGLNLRAREIKYRNREISDTSFFDAGFVVSGQWVHSNYVINLGTTSVKRAEAEGVVSKSSSADSGFSGSLNWRTELSSRSTIDALALTELTDTSSVLQNTAPGNPDDVQLSTDVVRNSLAKLTYLRADASLRTRLWLEYRELDYSESPLDRVVKTFGAQLGFPVTQRVSSGIYLNFANTEQVDILREDKRFSVGTNVDVNFTSKLSGSFNVAYRTKESTNPINNYDEFSLLASINYGFGGVQQRATSNK